MKLDAVFERIKRLRALATSANEFEAAAAAAAAEKLMQEHRIAEAELEAHGAAPEEEVTEGEALFTARKVDRWKLRIANRVSILHGCKIFFWSERPPLSATDQRRQQRCRIIGRASDVAMVAYLYAWLTVEIERLTQLHGRGKGRSWMHAYRLGAATGACEAMTLAETKVRAVATSAALVKVDARAEAAAAFVATTFPSVRTRKVTSYVNPEAYGRGERHGRTLHQRAALPVATARMLGTGK
jgi:hypothetical protein